MANAERGNANVPFQTLALAAHPALLPFLLRFLLVVFINGVCVCIDIALGLVRSSKRGKCVKGTPCVSCTAIVNFVGSANDPTKSGSSAIVSG